MVKKEDKKENFLLNQQTIPKHEFSSKILERDNFYCTIPTCREKAEIAHFIMEPRLFMDGDQRLGGHFLENAVSLCPMHDYHAKQGFIPPNALRHWAGLDTILPVVCKKDNLYDRWGNEIFLHTGKIEYPEYSSTPHFKDFLNKPLIINITKKSDKEITEYIPVEEEVTGNVHFFVSGNKLVAVYNDDFQIFLSYEDTIEWAEYLGLGLLTPFKATPLSSKWEFSYEWQLILCLKDLGEVEVIIRNFYPFYYSQFAQNMAQVSVGEEEND